MAECQNWILHQISRKKPEIFHYLSRRPVIYSPVIILLAKIQQKPDETIMLALKVQNPCS